MTSSTSNAIVAIASDRSIVCSQQPTFYSMTGFGGLIVPTDEEPESLDSSKILELSLLDLRCMVPIARRDALLNVCNNILTQHEYTELSVSAVQQLLDSFSEIDWKEMGWSCAASAKQQLRYDTLADIASTRRDWSVAKKKHIKRINRYWSHENWLQKLMEEGLINDDLLSENMLFKIGQVAQDATEIELSLDNLIPIFRQIISNRLARPKARKTELLQAIDMDYVMEEIYTLKKAQGKTIASSSNSSNELVTKLESVDIPLGRINDTERSEYVDMIEDEATVNKGNSHGKRKAAPWSRPRRSKRRASIITATKSRFTMDLSNIDPDTGAKKIEELKSMVETSSQDEREKNDRKEELEEIEICLRYLRGVKKQLTRGQFLQRFQRLVEVVGFKCDGLEDLVEAVLIRENPSDRIESLNSDAEDVGDNSENEEWNVEEHTENLEAEKENMENEEENLANKVETVLAEVVESVATVGDIVAGELEVDKEHE